MTIDEKIKLVEEKRKGCAYEVTALLKKLTWWEKRINPRHCGMPMLRLEILKADRTCSKHVHYNIGPVDEYICQCPDCCFTETERSMY